MDPIVKAQKFLGQGQFPLSRNLLTHLSPRQKIQLLYQLADQMSNLMADISEYGEEVPALITPGAYRYLKLMEGLVQNKQREC
jgi:hypothetical protein